MIIILVKNQNKTKTILIPDDICDRLWIDQPSTAFSQITFLYRPLAQFMLIVMVFKKYIFELRLKNYERPNVIVPNY